jgi:ADP-ribose pyrophosphatase YjhB (NUDIX family)
MVAKRLIPKNLYKKFTSSMPLFCLELVIENSGRFIFVKRRFPPAANKWWLPGGRLFFNEDLIQAVRRILKEELGIKKVKSIKFLGLEGTSFRKGYFNLPSHTINAIFFVKIDNFQAESIKLDLVNHSDYKWFGSIPRNAHPHLKKFLKLSGF